MPTEIILHVGMEKTGSSAIQRAFRRYDDGSLAFAQTDWANHSMPLQLLFRQFDSPPPPWSGQGVTRETLPQWRRRAAEQVAAALTVDRDRLILSAEGALNLRPEEHGRLRDYLHQYAKRIRVIAYVRDALGYAPSAFQEAIKRGGGRFFVPTQWFRLRVGALIDTYGAENVELVPFDRSRFAGNSVVSDFAARIGAAKVPPEVPRTNESLSAFATGALFVWLAASDIDASAEGYRARGALVRLLLRLSANRRDTDAPWAASSGNDDAVNRCGVSKFRFDADLVRRHVDMDDLGWMESRLGAKLLPDPTTQDQADTCGVGSADDLQAIGEAAFPWLGPTLRHKSVVPRAETTAAAMAALFERFLVAERSGAAGTA